MAQIGRQEESRGVTEGVSLASRQALTWAVDSRGVKRPRGTPHEGHDGGAIGVTSETRKRADSIKKSENETGY